LILLESLYIYGFDTFGMHDTKPKRATEITVLKPLWKVHKSMQQCMQTLEKWSTHTSTHTF